MNVKTVNKGLADALKSWLGILTIFIGGAYSILEYIEHKQAVKVERSLSYVGDYRRGEIANAKLALNQLLADNNNDIVKILSHEYKNQEALNKAYDNFIIKITNQSVIQRNLEVMFSFFEEAAVCVDKKLCDRDVIKIFFNDDAKSFFNAYYPYVCRLRRQWKNDTVYLKVEKFFVQSLIDICI